jgi:probable selenium-dependent hydroxylase accessory protein YqeC
LNAQETSLKVAISAGAREHVALVGGGGKTTMMFALAGEFCAEGNRVVTTTTTKIWRWEAAQVTCQILQSRDPAWEQKTRECISRHGHVFLGGGVLDSGKIKGIASETADALFASPWIDSVIVEADGAAGRPVKAPDKNEPVIPSSASLVIGIVGLEALGRRVDSKFVFRLKCFERLTGMREGETLTAGAMSRVFLQPEGLFKGAPRPARKVVFLNKIEMLKDQQHLKELIERILGSSQTLVERVLVGSLKGSEYHFFTGEP